MKYEIQLVNPLDVVVCQEAKVHLNYRFRSAKFNVASEFILQSLKEGRVRDLNGELSESEKEEVVIEEEISEELGTEVETEEDEGIDLELLTKSELFSFIKENNLNAQKLGVTQKTSVTKIREAIVSHLEEANKDD